MMSGFLVNFANNLSLHGFVSKRRGNADMEINDSVSVGLLQLILVPTSSLKNVPKSNEFLFTPPPPPSPEEFLQGGCSTVCALQM